MVNRVLLIAFHFPPMHSSSGIQRTLNFTKYLQENNWLPAVLTVIPRAYESTDSGQLKEVPGDVEVISVFALDAARDLAIGGRYFGWMALPDRWISWLPAGIYRGLRWIQKKRPKVIWSTSPIATAHLIGWFLHRLTGLPWVADLRDSLTEENYPQNLTHRKVLRWIERRIVRNASRVVFTTPTALKMYAERYPEQPSSRWVVIQNGFDENNFVSAEAGLDRKATQSKKSITLVHSGLLYLSERDPRPFFDALAALHASGRIKKFNLQVVLRATGHDQEYAPMLEKRGIADIVQLAPGISYHSALQEMLKADGLLLFQAANCNHQIPAKLYEYLRAQRPIFAMTDSGGDTAEVLRNVGVDTIVPLDNAQIIESRLESFLEDVSKGAAPIAPAQLVEKYSRRSGASRVAELFDEVS